MLNCKFKNARKPLIVIALFTMTACANFDAKRLAPPGIVKYEDIAGDEEPNPAIVEIVKNQTEITDREFPNLSKAPTARDLPPIRARKIVDAEIFAMAAAGDELTGAVEADRTAAENDRVLFEELARARDDFRDQLTRANAAAKRERRDPPPTATN